MSRPFPIGDSPSGYQPNPTDDRKVSGPASDAYLRITTALEEVSELTSDPVAVRFLSPKVRAELRGIERRLRRAAWMVVAYHADEVKTPMA